MMNKVGGEMGSIQVALIFLICFIPHHSSSSSSSSYPTQTHNPKGNLIQVKNGPEDVVWVVQFSDLHFSPHHPERALDFKAIAGPTLSMINPSLVLVTGDLTDGKSKDMLTMKQDEEEWIEYQNVMQDVVKTSGLDKTVFYDLRGNHDNFGVPFSGSKSDFFSAYSFNGQLGRHGSVNSVVIQTGERKLLFVGFDSTTYPGLRGPTNLFGHPTDQLLSQLSASLSHWGSQSITKIAFGHFPLSFSASSPSGKTLKDVFLTHSLAAYLCGHLHTKFGKNLKRHHRSNHQQLIFRELIQFKPSGSSDVRNCSDQAEVEEQFWELEMGDWRKSRSMRVLAVDRGHISFVDLDFKFGSNKTIILPTFPLDSRFTGMSYDQCKCKSLNCPSYDTIRALVFSASPIVSVVARIYDSRPGFLIEVFETSLKRLEFNSSRGDLYSAPWHFGAFEDSSPKRYLLQIEATDNLGRSTLSELRPFSVKGHRAQLSWRWKEFVVMGCQWSGLYYPLFCSLYFVMFLIILVPKVLLSLSTKRYTYKHYTSRKRFIDCLAWIFTELYNVPFVWVCLVCYLFYLILCPWMLGRVSTDDIQWGYMTYRGWVLSSNTQGKVEFLGFPDIMVVVLPHLVFVILPATLVIMALAAERGMYHDYFLSISGKKQDDNQLEAMASSARAGSKFKFLLKNLYLRKVLLVITLAIWWKHFKACRALMKAYEMNPLIHFPIYSLSIPVLLAYTVYKTGSI